MVALLAGGGACFIGAERRFVAGAAASVTAFAAPFLFRPPPPLPGGGNPVRTHACSRGTGIAPEMDGIRRRRVPGRWRPDAAGQTPADRANRSRSNRRSDGADGYGWSCGVRCRVLRNTRQ